MIENKPLYVLHPGLVISENDGQKHYLDAPRLAYLYGIKKSDYVVYCPRKEITKIPRRIIHLYPMKSGNYTLPE